MGPLLVGFVVFGLNPKLGIGPYGFCLGFCLR
jgi:hypothetical protein